MGTFYGWDLKIKLNQQLKHNTIEMNWDVANIILLFPNNLKFMFLANFPFVLCAYSEVKALIDRTFSALP
jgi:hypothetical protein